MMVHIGNSGVMELLLKLISCEEVREGEGIVQVFFLSFFLSFFLFSFLFCIELFFNYSLINKKSG